MNKHLGDNPLEKKKGELIENEGTEESSESRPDKAGLEDSVYARLCKEEASYPRLLSEFNDEASLSLALDNLKKQGKIEELDLHTYAYPNMFRIFRRKPE